MIKDEREGKMYKLGIALDPYEELTDDEWIAMQEREMSPHEKRAFAKKRNIEKFWQNYRKGSTK